MRDRIEMSKKELERLEVIRRVTDGVISQRQAARQLKVSERQMSVGIQAQSESSETVKERTVNGRKVNTLFTQARSSGSNAAPPSSCIRRTDPCHLFNNALA